MTTTNPDVPIDIYSIGMIHLSVCADANLTPEEVVKLVNLQSPTGIRSQWAITEKVFKGGEPNPSPCHDHPTTRKHYLLTC